MSSRNWTPSAGSIYYLLGHLKENEYLTEIYTPELAMKKYVATSKGKALLVLEMSRLEFSLKRSLILTSILARLINSKSAAAIAAVLEPLSNEIVVSTK